MSGGRGKWRPVTAAAATVSQGRGKWLPLRVRPAAEPLLACALCRGGWRPPQVVTDRAAEGKQ